MNKRRKKQSEDVGTRAGKEQESPPLVGLEPTNPSKPNRAFLVVALVLFLAWLGVLIWLGIR